MIRLESVSDQRGDERKESVHSRFISSWHIFNIPPAKAMDDVKRWQSRQ